MSFPRHPHVLSTTNLMPQVTGINLPTLAERECIYFTPANEHLGQALEDEITAHKSTCLKLDLEQQLRASIEAQLCFERAKISEIEESYAACHIDLQRVIADNIELRCRIHALEKRNKTLLEQTATGFKLDEKAPMLKQIMVLRNRLLKQTQKTGKLEERPRERLEAYHV